MEPSRASSQRAVGFLERETPSRADHVLEGEFDLPPILGINSPFCTRISRSLELPVPDSGKGREFKRTRRQVYVGSPEDSLSYLKPDACSPALKTQRNPKSKAAGVRRGSRWRRAASSGSASRRRLEGVKESGPLQSERSRAPTRRQYVDSRAVFFFEKARSLSSHCASDLDDRWCSTESHVALHASGVVGGRGRNRGSRRRSPSRTPNGIIGRTRPSRGRLGDRDERTECATCPLVSRSRQGTDLDDREFKRTKHVSCGFPAHALESPKPPPVYDTLSKKKTEFQIGPLDAPRATGP